MNCSLGYTMKSSLDVSCTVLGVRNERYAVVIVTLPFSAR